MLRRAGVAIPGRFVADTEVFGEEEVQTESATGTGVEIAAVGAVEAGVERIQLELHCRGTCILGNDGDFFFEALASVPAKAEPVAGLRRGAG